MQHLHFFFHLATLLAVCLAAAGAFICFCLSTRRRIWFPIFCFFLLSGAGFTASIVQNMQSHSSDAIFWGYTMLLMFSMALAMLPDFLYAILKFKGTTRIILYLTEIAAAVFAVLILRNQFFFAFLMFFASMIGAVAFWKLSVLGDYDEPLPLKLLSLFTFTNGIAFFIEVSASSSFYFCNTNLSHILCTAGTAIVYFLCAAALWKIVCTYYLGKKNEWTILISLFAFFAVYLMISYTASSHNMKRSMHDQNLRLAKIANYVKGNLLRVNNSLEALAKISIESGWPEQILNSKTFSMPPLSNPEIMLLNDKGFCVAVSVEDPQNPVRGINFSSYDYVQNAFNGKKSAGLKNSLYTKKPVFFFAKRIPDKTGKTLGIMLIRKDLSQLFHEIPDVSIAVLTPNGQVHASGRLLPRNTMSSVTLSLQSIPGFTGWKLLISEEYIKMSSAFFAGHLVLTGLWAAILVCLVICILQYISQNRKSAQYKRAKDILDSTSAGILIMNPDMEIIDMNPYALQILEYDREELLKRGLSIFHYDRERASAAAKKAQKTILKNGSYNIELPIYLRDGREIKIKMIGAVMAGSEQNSNLPPETVWAFSDVTEYVVSREALALHREQLRSFVEHIPEHFFIAEPDGTFRLSSNPLIERAMKKTPGTGLKDFFDEKTTRFYMDIFSDILRTGIPATVEHEVVFNGLPGKCIDTIFPIRHQETITQIGCFSRHPNEYER